MYAGIHFYWTWLIDLLWHSSCVMMRAESSILLWGLAQPGRGRSSVLKSCWASSSREHGCSAPTLDRDWSQCYAGLWGTLPCPVLWGAMRALIANPVKSTCTSTTPQLSERAGADASAYNRWTARLIPRSWLQERCGERGDNVVRGGRLLPVLSRRRDLQKPDSIGVISAFLGRGADRRWGFGAS